MEIKEKLKKYVENMFVLACVTLWVLLIAALVYDPIKQAHDMSSMTKYWISKYDEIVDENKKLFAENIALKRKLAFTVLSAFSIIAYGILEVIINFINSQ